MTEAKTARTLTEDDRKIRAKLASALWLQENRSALSEDNQARQDAFKAVRKDYLIKAAQLHALLKRRGIDMTLTDASEEG